MTEELYGYHFHLKIAFTRTSIIKMKQKSTITVSYSIVLVNCLLKLRRTASINEKKVFGCHDFKVSKTWKPTGKHRLLEVMFSLKYHLVLGTTKLFILKICTLTKW